MDWLHGGFPNRQLPWGRFWAGGWSQRGPLPAKILVRTFLKPKGIVKMVTYGVEGHINKSKSSITLNLLCCLRVWRVREFKYKRLRYYPELAEHQWFRCWVDCSNIWIAVLPKSQLQGRPITLSMFLPWDVITLMFDLHRYRDIDATDTENLEVNLWCSMADEGHWAILMKWQGSLSKSVICHIATTKK